MPASRKKLATSKSLQLLLNKNMFDIVFNSEQNEGFALEDNVLVSKTKDGIDIDKRTILAFLEAPETKVRVVVGKNGKVKLYATNLISNETIVISGLGDHFIALVMIVLEAQKTISKIEKCKEKPELEMPNIITHQFIKTINLQLQPHKEGEIGIGEYRYLDFLGRPSQVKLEGMEKYISLESAAGGNVINKMSELVKWINNDAFTDEDIFIDLADFHSAFIKIHPFRDGNGRTCRLLTNYFLMLKGLDLLDINEKNKEAYNHCLDFINCEDVNALRQDFPDFDKYYKTSIYPQIKGLPNTRETKLIPLANFFKNNLVKESSHAILRDIINYKGNNAKLVAEETSENM